MRFEFIRSHHSSFSVQRMCRLFGVTRSGYYSWRNRGESKRAKANKELLDEIKRVYWQSRRTYGSPRITRELNEGGIFCGENRVSRLMRENNIIAKTKKRYKVTTNSSHKLAVVSNVIEQDFHAERTNQIWASDITYIWTREGWLYLSVILDLYSRKVIGWSLESHLKKELVIDSLHKALKTRQIQKGLIFHSDQGIQYCSDEFQKILRHNKIIQSMSGKGNCYDNAVIESFFHTLKTELVQFEKYKTKLQAYLSVFDYIEIFYNRQRRHSALKYKSPVEFEKVSK